MAVGITDTASTGAAGLLPEVRAQHTRDSLLPNLVMPNLVDRSFEAELSGRRADTIHIDGAGGSTANTISGFDVTTSPTLGEGGTLASEVMTFLGQVDIDIGTHAYKFWDLEHELDLLTEFPLLQRGAERTAYVVAQKVDDDGAGLIDDFNQTVGTKPINLTDSNILRAVQYLNDADAPEDRRFALVSASQQIGMMETEKYINRLYGTTLNKPEDGKFKGFFGSLYGIDWYMSTNTEGSNAAGHDNGMWFQEALARVMVDDQRVATDYEITTDSHRHAVHSIYGWQEIRDTSGVYMLGK